MRTIVFTSFGVTVELGVEDELFERALAVLPPGWSEGDPADVQTRVALSADGDVLVDDMPVAAAAGARQAIGSLDAAIRARISLLAPAHIFVHAGVAAHRERAIVIPGSTRAGKSTLVGALVRAGATYCSDEFAVLDADGLVHPYAKPLSLRWHRRQHDIPLEAAGIRVATEPLPIGLIAITRYEKGAEWAPERREAGEGALALLEHTIPARSRPAEALAAVQRAAAAALVLKGTRGEATTAAAILLTQVDAGRSA